MWVDLLGDHVINFYILPAHFTAAPHSKRLQLVDNVPLITHASM